MTLPHSPYGNTRSSLNENRQPVGVADTFPADVGKVYAWMRVTGAADQAIVLLHVGDDACGNRTVIKGLRAVLRDQLQALREIGLHESFAGSKCAAVVLEKYACGAGMCFEPLGACAQRVGEIARYGDAIPGEANCGCHDLRQRHAAEGR